MVALDSRHPTKTEFGTGTAFEVGIVQWDGNFVDEGGAEAFDGTTGSEVVRVTGDDNSSVKSADEGSNGLAGLQGVTVAAVGREDFKTNMTRTDEDVLRIADPEIDMAGIRTFGSDDAKMVGGYKIAGGVAGNNLDETQTDLAESEWLRRQWEGFDAWVFRHGIAKELSHASLGMSNGKWTFGGRHSHPPFRDIAFTAGSP